jgi:hypothetical protein
VHAEGLFPTIDIGVLVLAEPAHDAQGPISPARLPAAGLLDQLDAAHQLQGLPLTVVGYGVSAMINNQTPDFSTLGTRRNGLQRAQALPAGLGILKVSSNVTTPNPVTPGVGDSGGPYFLEDSSTAVGIVSSTLGALTPAASWWAATRWTSPRCGASSRPSGCHCPDPDHPPGTLGWRPRRGGPSPAGGLRDESSGCSNQDIAALTLGRQLRDLRPAQRLSAGSPRLPRIARQARAAYPPVGPLRRWSAAPQRCASRDCFSGPAAPFVGDLWSAPPSAADRGRMVSWWTEAGWTAVSEPGPGQQIA